MKRILSAILAFAQLFAWAPLTASAQTTLSFAGYTWNVKTGRFAPGPNNWTDAPSDVFVDAQGRLHLNIVARNGVWYSSEVFLPASLGYGTYAFDIDTRIDNIDPNIVVAPFLYQDDTHEIDIEFSNWQSPGEWMGNYSVQPYTVAGNQIFFPVPVSTSPSSHIIDWKPTGIMMQSSQDGRLVKRWSYTGASNFAPGGERLHINHWLIKGLPPTDGQAHELIIRNFTFTPYVTAMAPAPTPVSVQSTAQSTTAITVPTTQTTTRVLRPKIPKRKR